jgi:hypothetical protein
MPLIALIGFAANYSSTRARAHGMIIPSKTHYPPEDEPRLLKWSEELPRLRVMKSTAQSVLRAADEPKGRRRAI